MEDYPEASEVLLSFRDQWELVRLMGQKDTPLYLAAMPPNQEPSRPGRFYGLPPEIKRELDTYRLYGLFQPWPQPGFAVTWDATTQTGRLGHTTHGVLWECYFNEAGRSGGWQDDLYQTWQTVEEDMGAAKIFTQPHEPTWEQGCTDFLGRLGYAPDPAHPGWWNKKR